MPPKRKSAVQTEIVPVLVSGVVYDNDSDNNKSVLTTKTSKSVFVKKPVALVKFNNDSCKPNLGSDRLQLAHAINNLVFKGDAFTSALEQLHEMTNERLTELDLQLESKQQEFDSLVQKIENDQIIKVNSLSSKYDVYEQDLESNFTNNKKDLERNHENRVKELELNFKNSQIETTQQLREFKLKACKDLATENGMLLVEKSDNDKILTEKATLANELKQLKDKFESSVNTEVGIEKGRCDAKINQEKTMMDLTYKMQTADVNAKAVQLEKEVIVLNNMIANLKNELAEQRNLTKEVASSASRSAINQSFGNK